MTAAVLIRRGGSLTPCSDIGSAPASARRDNAQATPGSRSMSFEKFFNDRFARFLQENFANPTQVAAAFNVRERTAEYWWQGINCPGGAKVALAFTLWPDAAGKHLTGQDSCDQSSERSSGPSSSPATQSQPEPTGSPSTSGEDATGSRGKRRAA